MTYLSDLASVLKADGIQLDVTEGALMGAPNGETISIWAALAERHGRFLAHVACALLWLVQKHHCRDQLAGVPMQPNNYARAFALLLSPVVAILYLIWRLT